ncbi:MAG: hypothetical protein IJ230_08570 [Clostridia bacterium]|nr:hypothetical protein [Clostridia bacterium]
MKRLNKVWAVLLAMAMMFCLLAGSAQAATASAYSTKTFKTAKRYTYMHNPGKGYEKDYKSVVYYTDDYFTLDPTAAKPNISLATASFCLSLAAMGSNDGARWQENDACLKAFLKKLGFRNFRSNDEFKAKPTADSLGFGVASKKVAGKDYTLIALGLRGAGYEAEWAGNFTLGRYGQHSDFAKNKEKVLAFLKQYIADNHIKGHVKLCLSGYSRGGAVGNLVAGAIDDGALKDTGITLGQKDLFAINFEPPQGALLSDSPQAAKYDNIWSFVNPNDLVPLVAMKEYGFGRYGRTWNYPTKQTTSNYSSKRKAMEKLFYAQSSHEVVDEYTADSFQMYKFDLSDGVIAKDKASTMTLPEFEQAVVTLLAEDLVGSRENFVNEYQNGFRTLMYIIQAKKLFTGSETDLDGFIKNLQNNLQKESMESRLQRAAKKPFDPTYGFNTVVSDLVTESMNDTGINNLNPVDLSVFLTTVVKLVAGLFVMNPDYAVTTILNVMKLINAHFPQVSFAWLMSMDPNYKGTADCY